MSDGKAMGWYVIALCCKTSIATTNSATVNNGLQDWNVVN